MLSVCMGNTDTTRTACIISFFLCQGSTIYHFSHDITMCTHPVIYHRMCNVK